MCFRPWTCKCVGCTTCGSLSHLREWLYPRCAKSAGNKPFLPVWMRDELSQTVSDLEKDWCGQKPSWISPPNSVSCSVDRYCSILPAFLPLSLDHLSYKIWARLCSRCNEKSRDLVWLVGIWAMQGCILVGIYARVHNCIQLNVAGEHSSHTQQKMLLGFFSPAI